MKRGGFFFEYSDVLHRSWLPFFDKFLTSFTLINRFLLALTLLLFLWCIVFGSCFVFFFLFYFFLFDFLIFFERFDLLIGCGEFGLSDWCRFVDLMRKFVDLFGESWGFEMIPGVWNLDEIVDFFSDVFSMETIRFLFNIEIDINVDVIIGSWYGWMTSTKAGVFVRLFFRCIAYRSGIIIH